MADVMVIAGTVDARQILEEIKKLDLSVAATVTTGYGRELISEDSRVIVYEGKLTAEGMLDLIQRTSPKILVDASHPYAREASVNAIKACKEAGIEYLRYERKEHGYSDTDIIAVETFEEAADIAERLEGNIFLTIGSNQLESFVKRILDYKNRLTARVLPDSKVLARCEQVGLTAQNLIAMKGPFSEVMNLEMFKHCDASVIVTKDSGDAGGTSEKIQAAKKLGIKVILVTRPDINYPMKVDTIEDVVRFVSRSVKREPLL